MSENPYRLPRTVVPARYELRLEPDLEAATFAGQCTVEVEVVEATDEIVLNAADLDIDEAWVEPRKGARIEADIALEPDTERVRLTLPRKIEPGEWFVQTRFRGILNDKLKGFYRSTFTDQNGDDRVIATTQFEATDARRAFPCWDEPDLKAVFGVTLVVPDGLGAFSNAGELQRETLGDGRVAVHFVDTMSMSTYLVAFVVGPLEATAPRDAGGTPIRVVHPPGKAHLTPFALDVAAFALDFFADYYGIAYPGDKLDLVAIPDFAFGAMENLGCVTFREILVLVDPETSTQSELERVVDVIAHELAHMWFGDLVTMRWWNGIWLNEAFATFMEMLATDAFRPAWRRWATFGISRTAAFDVDALHSTRPIEFEVVSPDDAEGMFDILTYEKGAAVVRMLEQHLGADRFREGIRGYLQANEYSNTETTDLWDALEAVSDEPVRRMADSWIFQGGFPLITVDLINDGSTVAISQQPFRYLDDDDDGTRWIVPLILSQERGGDIEFERVVLDGDTTEVSLWEPVDWVLANAESTGFYRVRYAPDLLRALAAHAGQLSALERYGLLDDLWATLLADKADLEDVLAVLDAFEHEEDYSVWLRIIGMLDSLRRICPERDRANLRGLVRGLIEPNLHRLGYERRPDDDDRTRQRRGALFEALGALAHDEVAVDRAFQLLDDEGIDPPMRAAAINVVAAHGDAQSYERLLEQFRQAQTPQDELRFLSALADFRQSELMARTLAMSITDEVRTQNAPYLLRRALTNIDCGPQAWTFIEAEWDTLNARFPSNSIVRMLEGVRSLSDPGVANDVHAFFVEHDVPQGARTLAQHLERLRVNVAFRERAADQLGDALG